MVVPMNTLSSNVIVSPVLWYHLQHLIVSDYYIFTFLMNVKWYHIVLIFISLITGKVEHLFMFAIGHSNFLCYELLVHILADLSIISLVFFLLILILCGCMCMLSRFAFCLFTLSVVLFAEQNFNFSCAQIYQSFLTGTML